MPQRALQINTTTGTIVRTADLVESSEVQTTPTINAVPRADASGKIAAGWIGEVPFAALPVAASGENSPVKVVRADDSRLGNPPVGGDLSGTALSATVDGIQGRAVANIAPSNGQGLVWNNTNNQWEPGTVSGEGGSSGDATSLQGRPVAIDAPSSGQALVWNTEQSRWEPGDVAAWSDGLVTEAHARHTGSSVSLPATGGGTLRWLAFNTTLVDTDNQIVWPTTELHRPMTWATWANYDSQAYRFECVIPGTYQFSLGMWAQSPNDASVVLYTFSETGVFIASYSLYGTYSAAAGNWRIVSGSVSIPLAVGHRVLFSFNTNATSGVVAHANYESRLSIVRFSGGTLSIDTGNATQIQGRDVAATAPAAGDALVWNGTAWAPGAGGGGGSTEEHVLIAASLWLHERGPFG